MIDQRTRREEEEEGSIDTTREVSLQIHGTYAVSAGSGLELRESSGRDDVAKEVINLMSASLSFSISSHVYNRIRSIQH